MEFGEHDPFDAFPLAGVQLDDPVGLFDPLLDLGDGKDFALLAGGLAAAVADVVLVVVAAPGAGVLHEQSPAALDAGHGAFEVVVILT